jgi:hypothetical protein
MKTVTKKIKLYKFEELSPKSQQNAIIKNQHINYYDDCIQNEAEFYIIDWAKFGISANCENLNVDLGRGQYLYFHYNSLFISNIKLFCDAIKPIVSKNILDGIRNNNLIVSFSVIHYGGNSGKQSVSIESYTNISDSLIEIAESAISQWVNSTLLKPLWESLNDSWINANSEEAIIETLKINEYDFTEDGERY